MSVSSAVSDLDSYAIARIDLCNALAEFQAITLEEVVDSADLQVRNDRKYLVAPQDTANILEWMADIERPRVLEIAGKRIFRYESLYFDSPELKSYYDAAYRRPRRTKIRTRTYVDSGICMLEVKMRDNRGQTVKHRLPYNLCHSRELTPEGQEFVASTGMGKVECLRPSLTSRYQRATLVFDESGVRMTIDIALTWCDAAGGSLAVPNLVLLETKSLARASCIDRLLWEFGYRPAAISKYCTGLAALRPALPANKWHRTLKDYVNGRMSQGDSLVT